MKPDDKICYCYHVSLRKLVNFARREKPERPSQMSDCLNAGTGCGWCIPILQMIFERASNRSDMAEDQDVSGLPQNAADYEAARKTYLKSDQKNQF
ncbi:MAG TPA: (2Fe-2S)-binding protein [Phycisphaerae bacterium]|nr:(2Fe-2S)-binding protein [Phycisphaerae bacterium]